MIHYGDITKISGYDVPIVDVVTGGSPCQDLSIAGKKIGLSGERSGLFLEQIRIIREMRKRDSQENGRSNSAIRPRYMVWENVPGALTIGDKKGCDFATVIEEIIKISEQDASVRVRVPSKGWTKSGCFYSADGRWSIAWRIHDSQFWGVPQRRKRIALVADFGGLSAPEILFERKGLRWDSSESGCAREEITVSTENSIGEAAGFPLGFRPENTKVYQETATTICNGTRPGFTCGVIEPTIIEMTSTKNTIIEDGVSPTLTARMGTGGNQINAVYIPTYKTVRRLTPLECERLQGFPDGWTDIGEWIDSKGKKHKPAESPRYKSLGNSIALPFWEYLARRICAQYERPMTMASLFDGIGGFPLAFQRAGAKPVWASEIEEFPIAVTKKHFPDSDKEQKIEAYNV